eukprot:2909496-Ditylum_brightwellii.AAC.1
MEIQLCPSPCCMQSYSLPLKVQKKSCIEAIALLAEPSDEKNATACYLQRVKVALSCVQTPGGDHAAGLRNMIINGQAERSFEGKTL